jgi:hypothetical protein
VLEHLERLLDEQGDTIGGRVHPLQHGRIERLQAGECRQCPHVLGGQRPQLELQHGAGLCPGRRELGTEGEQAQHRHVSQLSHDAVQELDGGRIGPVQVLDDEQQRVAGRVGNEQPLEDVQGRRADVSWSEPGHDLLALARNGEQIGEDGHRLRGPQTRRLHGLGHPAQLLLRCSAHVEGEQPLQVADDRVEHRVVVMG